MPEILAPRLARIVIAIVTCGFFFGGFDGLMTSTMAGQEKALGVIMLTALLALHLRNCVRRTDGAPPRLWQYTLGAQAALTFLPMFHEGFAKTWYGNVGFLAGAALILFRDRRIAWTLFGVVIAVDAPFAHAIRPALAETLYLLIGHVAFVGIVVYGMARLADLVGTLHRARLELAETEVARERLAFAENLNSLLGTSLSAIVLKSELALRLAPTEPSRAREELEESVDMARRSLEDMRSVSAEARTLPSDVRDVPSNAWTTWLTRATLALMVLPLPLRMLARTSYTPLETTGFVLLIAIYLGLTLYNVSRPRPRFWMWTLSAQVALAYLGVWIYGDNTWAVYQFLPGVLVVLLPGMSRWVIPGLLLAQNAPFGVWGDDVWAAVYDVIWMGERAAVVYGLARMADLVVELHRVRRSLASASVAQERLRFARDLHDLLGYSLSAIAMKSELAFRLLARGSAKALDELQDSLDVARQALNDVRAVASGYRDMSLAAEALSARSVLAAAGIDARVTVDTPPLPSSLDTVLATVLREAVTNVLRHSSARYCTINAATVDDTIRLTVSNDGLPPTPGPGKSHLGATGPANPPPGPATAGPVTTRPATTRPATPGAAGTGGETGAEETGAEGTRAEGTRAEGTGPEETEAEGTRAKGTGVANLTTRVTALGGTLTAAVLHNRFELSATIPVEAAPAQLLAAE